MQNRTEIPQTDLHQHEPELREALEAVCNGPAFRTSPKSCQFLRHIVEHTVHGAVDELKERLIGMSLLGRDASYDTGSDAGVRVRANDVRKRLVTHNDTETPVNGLSFELPAGTYVPRFFREGGSSAKLAALFEGSRQIIGQHEIEEPLSLLRVAAPTLVALFLCVIFLRWQIEQEHPFSTFWQQIFQGHRVKLYLEPAQEQHGQELIGFQKLQSAAPLINLAGQFRTQFTITDSPSASAGDVLVSIGSFADRQYETREGPDPNRSPVHTDRDRLTIEDTAEGREIFEHSGATSHRYLDGSAALLTITSGYQQSIRIDGTDDAAVRSLVGLLCERDTFPDAVADSLENGTTIQVVFPKGKSIDMRVLHETSTKAGTVLAQ